ncbi:hypothetical protein [Inquilinus limosus]|uniref:hypothetical protein n=1 Tax=Inquilinus limosus TaxID=171674 RepID=UPI0011982826|nr:hypothetical protein [Inquilinus limosus]
MTFVTPSNQPAEEAMEQGRTSGGARIVPLARPSAGVGACRSPGRGPLRAAGISPLVVRRRDGTPGSEGRCDGERDSRAIDPAYVQYRPDGSRIEFWYRDNRLNRIDGPAVIERAANGRILSQEWWIDGRNITDLAEAYLRETGARYPLDPGHQSILLCRQLLGGERAAMLADCLGWRSILTALCYVGPFWVLLGLSITLFH